ncbi:MAG: hypothetical protein AABZ14_01440 [Candidatus Margulisiibacteriota bacterium]
MKTDTQLKKDGIQFLINKMGGVEAERFISLLIKDKCDYIKVSELIKVRKSQ